MQEDHSPINRAQWSFGQLITWHLMRGTRPGGTLGIPGRRWSNSAFADATGLNDRTIRYWLRDQHLPPETETIERILFGNDICYAEWRLELRNAQERSFAGKKSAHESESATHLAVSNIIDDIWRPAIAVLPFANSGGDPDQQHFADGLTDDIITELASWRSFPVIARGSTFSFRGRAVDIRTISKDLGARYIVEGTSTVIFNAVSYFTPRRGYLGSYLRQRCGPNRKAAPWR
jgi:hypothetical protein